MFDFRVNRINILGSESENYFELYIGGIADRLLKYY